MYSFLKRTKHSLLHYCTVKDIAAADHLWRNNSCSHQRTVKWLMMQWRIIKERYCQAHSKLEPTNQNLNRRLANLTLRVDGITDLKGPNWYKQGHGGALKPNMKDYLMNHVHLCHNLDPVEWNDCTVYCTNTVCCEKHLRSGDRMTQTRNW